MQPAFGSQSVLVEGAARLSSTRGAQRGKRDARPGATIHNGLDFCEPVTEDGPRATLGDMLAFA